MHWPTLVTRRDVPQGQCTSRQCGSRYRHSFVITILQRNQSLQRQQGAFVGIIGKTNTICSLATSLLV